MFGALAEEKEIAKIAVKTSEAKSKKSFDTLQILAQYITDKCLMDLIFPIKDVLYHSHSFKIVHKAQEALRFISIGLIDNTFISTESLLKFAYGTASESIPQLVGGNKLFDINKKQKQKKKVFLEEPVDCFIIDKMPVGRSGVRSSHVKSSTNANSHLFVEFGLRLCFSLLKRDRVKGDGFKPFLDPFIIVYKNCLTAKHIKVLI